jgi:hypothetical protein
MTALRKWMLEELQRHNYSSETARLSRHNSLLIGGYASEKIALTELGLSQILKGVCYARQS